MSSEKRRGAAGGSGSAASSSSGPRSAGGPSPRPSRRSFTAEYKLAIVAEYENAPNGEKGAILEQLSGSADDQEPSTRPRKR